MGQARLSHLLGRKSILFKGCRERVLASTSVGFIQKLGAGEGSARNCVVECLGLGFCGWRCGEGSLNFRRRSSVREKLDFVGDGTAEVVERFTDMGRVVISFIRVLRA